MDSVVLDFLPYALDVPALMQTLRVRDGSSHEIEVRKLIAEAEAIAMPKAVYRLVFIDDKGSDFIVADGRRFESRVLRVNLDGLHRFFAYVCTSGRELAAWVQEQQDLLAQFYADMISAAVLYSAMTSLTHHLTDTYSLGQTAVMNPGSLADWPIQQQRPLFDLLGDVHAAIGVELTSSLLMKPTKSVSGILFSSEETFASCQMCPREDCPNRRAAYDAGLFERKYAGGSTHGPTVRA